MRLASWLEKTEVAGACFCVLFVVMQAVEALHPPEVLDDPSVLFKNFRVGVSRRKESTEKELRGLERQEEKFQKQMSAPAPEAWLPKTKVRQL
eukprot:6236708-Amphidinium_carterae.1